MDRLADIAAKTAMEAAGEYVRQRGYTSSTLDMDALVAALRDELKVAIDEALDDAKMALDAGMGAIAQATFIASMRVAGIRAAKSVVGA